MKPTTCLLLSLLPLTLTGCVSMPVTTLTDGAGHTITCGGEQEVPNPAIIAGRAIRAHLCVKDAESKGYEIAE